MSCVVLFGFDSKGNSFEIGEAENAWKGCMAIWQYMSEKYLNETLTFASDYSKVWGLADSNSVSRTDKIVLISTFDDFVVKAENIDYLLEAYRAFDKETEGMTNLSEQIEIIEENKGIIDYLAFHQNSISCDMWFDCNINEVGHQFLFDDEALSPKQ